MAPANDGTEPNAPRGGSAPETAALRAELQRLGGRLRALWFAYGVARLAVLAGVALAVLYGLDRALALPAAVRVVLLGVLVLALAVLVGRGLVYPLRRRLSAEDVACAVERRFPQFDGRLLSTLELEGARVAPEHNVSLQLVQRLRAATVELRAGLDLAAIFDRRPLSRITVLGAAVCAGVIAYAAWQPELAGIFVRRLVGGDERWPQRTRLYVAFPQQAEHFAVEWDGDRPVRVKIARGASLPVTVIAQGVRPEFVELVAESDAGDLPNVALAPTAGTEWVGRFRAVREDFRFYPHDGDSNDDGDAVQVEVFEPPAVREVFTSITYPAYTGLPPKTEPRGDVEAPVGSRVEVEVALDAPPTSARLVFDPGGAEIPLAPVAEANGRWKAAFPVAESCSYAVHLVGANGFQNLEPVSYAVVAVADRPPTLRVLEPSRADLDVTPDGLVALRVAADDDYGVAELSFALRPFEGGGDQTFDLLDAAAGAPAAAPAPAGDKRRLVYRLLDLSKTDFERGEGRRLSQVGDSYVYRVEAADAFTTAAGEPAANRAVAPDRTIDIVAPNEKLRLLTERQMRLKEDVRAVRQLQEEKHVRLKEILAEYEASEGDVKPSTEDLAALEIGQNQVTNRVTRIAREFADLFEEYLLNRLDKSAAADRLVALLEERKRASVAVDGFDFGVFRPIVEPYRAGTFGKLDAVGQMLEMLGLSLDVAETEAPRAAARLSDARLLAEASERPPAIEQALAAQEQALRLLDALLVKMDEWEDFQEILTLFRDLLEDQRDLTTRTQNTLREGNK